MDRIHRLGQRRPIRITRLIIENSIESRIVQLQEKKTALVESTVGKVLKVTLKFIINIFCRQKFKGARSFKCRGFKIFVCHVK